MIVVSGVMTFDPASHDRVVESARVLVAETLKEPGCHTYGFWANPDQPGQFRVFEEWESQDALTAHFSAPHFATFGGGLGELGLVSMDVHRYIEPRVADLFDAAP